MFVLSQHAETRLLTHIYRHTHTFYYCSGLRPLGHSWRQSSTSKTQQKCEMSLRLTKPNKACRQVLPLRLPNNASNIVRQCDGHDSSCDGHDFKPCTRRVSAPSQRTRARSPADAMAAPPRCHRRRAAHPVPWSGNTSMAPVLRSTRQLSRASRTTSTGVLEPYMYATCPQAHSPMRKHILMRKCLTLPSLSPGKHLR